MLLLWLLAAVPAPEIRPQHEFTDYLRVAAAYASQDHSAALREIRQWQPPEIVAAVADLRRRGNRLRSVPSAPDEIAFGTVEAAVLMHAEAGLAALQALSLVDAEFHLDISTNLFEWSLDAAVKARRRAIEEAEARRRAAAEVPAFPQSPSPLPPMPQPSFTPGLDIHERIDRRDFYQALAATALAIGFPATARPFAEAARRAAPLDAEVQLIFGCVAESFAEEKLLRHLDSETPRLRDEADRALRDALALEPTVHEARLRLGRLLLVRGRLIEAEHLLETVLEHGGDDRQRYLALLFLGRLAEGCGRHDDAAHSYARALEGWPDSQAARLALAHALERSTGPAAARPLVAASLSASRRLDRAADPWWLYPFGPPGLASATLDRVWKQALGR